MSRYHGPENHESIMLLKIIAFVAAAIPLVLFVRAMFFRRPTRIREGVREFKKQVDVAVWIFLGLVGCVVAFATGKLVWTWWSAL
jgi:NADH:ubiquinone oxidoreductase subunit 6 (subunit J)